MLHEFFDFMKVVVFGYGTLLSWLAAFFILKEDVKITKWKFKYIVCVIIFGPYMSASMLFLLAYGWITDTELFAPYEVFLNAALTALCK